MNTVLGGLLVAAAAFSTSGAAYAATDPTAARSTGDGVIAMLATGKDAAVYEFDADQHPIRDANGFQKRLDTTQGMLWGLSAQKENYLWVKLNGKIDNQEVWVKTSSDECSDCNVQQGAG